MIGVDPSRSDGPGGKLLKWAVIQPILFIRALPYVAVQLSAYGARFVSRPVVWMALGVHGLLLLSPAVDLTTVKSTELVEAEPEEAPVLEVQNLSDLIGVVEPAEIEPPPPESEAPPPEEPAATVLPPEDIVLIDPEDIPEELPDPEPKPDPLYPEPETDPAPSFDRRGAQQNAGNRLRGAGPTEPPAPLGLRIKERGCFFDPSAPGASSIDAPLINGLTDLVFRSAVTTEESDALEAAMLAEFQANGDQLNSVGIYSGASVYQLVDVTGSEEIGYVTLVESKGGFGWFAGVWSLQPDESNCLNWSDYIS